MSDPLMKLKAVTAPAVSPDARSRALEKLEGRIAAGESVDTSPRRRRFFRPRVVTACGAALAAVALVVGGLSTLPNSDAEPGELLSKAVAATTPRPNQIVHERTTYRQFGTDTQGRSVQETLHYENWTLDNLTFRTVIRSDNGRVMIDEEVTPNRRRQYTAGEEEILFESRSDTTEIGSGNKNRLQRLLGAVKEGEVTVRPGGTAQVHGRPVTKLIFTPKDRGIWLKETVYVDSETDLPVRSESFYDEGYASTGVGGSVAMDIHHDITDYEQVERLPDTPQNRRLLKLGAGVDLARD